MKLLLLKYCCVLCLFLLFLSHTTMVAPAGPGETARFTFGKSIMPQFSQLVTVLRRAHKKAKADACGGDQSGEHTHSCCAHAMQDDKETQDLRDALGYNLEIDVEVPNTMSTY